MNYEHTINSTVYEASVPAHGNYAELATAFAVWNENHKRAASCDSGTCNTQLNSQTKPYGSKIANENPCHRSQRGRRELSVHYKT